MTVSIVFNRGNIRIVIAACSHNSGDIDIAVCIDGDSVDFASIGSVSLKMSVPDLIAIRIKFDGEEASILKSIHSIRVLREAADVDVAKLIDSHAVRVVGAVIGIVIAGYPLLLHGLGGKDREA